MSNYDFDTQDKYVEFTFEGNVYQFWYPTVEQSMQAQKLTGDENKQSDFMFDLVKKPEGATYSDFSTIKDKMTVKQVLMFKKMLDTELNLG